MHRITPKRIVIAAMIVGLTLSLATWNKFEPVTADSFAYMNSAQALAEGRGFVGITDRPTILYPIGYPLLISFGRLLSGNGELVGRLVSLILSIASIPLLYLIARRMLPARQAAAGAALFALVPLRVEVSTKVWTESSYLFAVLVATLLLWLWYERKTNLWPLLLGLALGACYLIRHEGMGLVPIAMATACFMNLGRRRTIAGLALVLAGFTMMALPYVAHMHGLTGQWRMSYKGAAVLSLSAAMDEDPSARTHIQLDESGQLVKTAPTLDPLVLAKRCLRNERIMFERLVWLLTPSLFAFTGAGLLALLGLTKHIVPRVGTLALVGAPLVFVAPFHVDDRMLTNVCALGVVLGAAGIAGAARLLAEKHRTYAVAIVCALVVLTLLDGNMVRNHLLHTPVARTNRNVGLWIAERYPELDQMLVPRASLGHWAHKLPRKMPSAPLDEVVEYARNEGIELIVLPRTQAHPSVCAWANTPDDRAGLEVIHQWKRYTLTRVTDGGE